MTGLKFVFIFSLVASAFLACHADDELDQLLRRVLGELKEQDVEAAENFIQGLKNVKLDDGKAAASRISVLDMVDGTLLSSGGDGPVQLTPLQMDKVVAAFKKQRWDSLQSDGLTILGKNYRLSSAPSAGSVVTFLSRNGTINMKKASFGLVVAQSPKGGMAATVLALQTATK
jgi:hypothetical protein